MNLSSQAKVFYKLLLRSAKLNMPTKAAQQFMIQRVREQFKMNKVVTDPKKLQDLYQRAYSVLIASTREADRATHGF